MIDYREQLGTLRDVEYPGGPFRGTAEVFWMDPETVFVFGLLKSGSSIDLRSGIEFLRERGVKVIYFERHGKIRHMPIDLVIHEFKTGHKTGHPGDRGAGGSVGEPEPPAGEDRP